MLSTEQRFYCFNKMWEKIFENKISLKISVYKPKRLLLAYENEFIPSNLQIEKFLNLDSELGIANALIIILNELTRLSINCFCEFCLDNGSVDLLLARPDCLLLPNISLIKIRKYHSTIPVNQFSRIGVSIIEIKRLYSLTTINNGDLIPNENYITDVAEQISGYINGIGIPSLALIATSYYGNYSQELIEKISKEILDRTIYRTLISLILTNSDLKIYPQNMLNYERKVNVSLVIGHILIVSDTKYLNRSNKLEYYITLYPIIIKFDNPKEEEWKNMVNRFCLALKKVNYDKYFERAKDSGNIVAYLGTDHCSLRSPIIFLSSYNNMKLKPFITIVPDFSL